MTPFKRFIRPGVLRNILRKAYELTGGQCAYAIEFEDEVLLHSGEENGGGFVADSANFISKPLNFNDIHSGQLRMYMPEDCSDELRDQFARAFEFAAFSIQELIDMERARRCIADEALAKYRELAVFHRSVPSINTSLRLRDVVGALINECRRENYPGELGMVFLSEPGTNHFRLAVQFGFHFGSNPQAMVESRLFLDVVKDGHGEIINDLSKDSRWGNQIPGIGSMAIIPIVSPNRVEGMLVLGSENKGLFEAAHRKSLSTLASVAGISVSNAFNFEGIQTLMNAILQALAEAIDSRDPYTAGHSERVAHLAVAFAYMLGESPAFPNLRFTDLDLRELYYSGILHDVGKIGIKEDVLTKKTRLPKRRLEVLRARFQLHAQVADFDWHDAYETIRVVNSSMTPSVEELEKVKNLSQIRWQLGNDRPPLLYDDELEALMLEYGNLTSEERDEIERHPAESERILQHIPLQEGYDNLLTIIRQHHERMDGSGYPDGLLGNELLLQSRLMAIVDIYDAITQERHYKPARTRSEALKILSKERDRGKLDSDLVDFFLTNVDTIEMLSERVRSTRVTHLSEIGNLSTL